MAYTIEISNQVKVEVKVGTYGKYLKLYKKEKWISFSEKLWWWIIDSADDISNSLKEGKDYELTVTSTKNIKIANYRNQNYVSFHEQVTVDEKTFNKYVNLNEDEWQGLRDRTVLISDLVDRDIIYKKGDGSWSLIKEAVTDDDDDLTYALAPRMSPTNIAFRVYAYLIATAIDNYVKQSCYGCLNDAPDQRSHMSVGSGCLQLWPDSVMYNFKTGRDRASLEGGLTKLNKAMTWSVPMPAKIDEDRLHTLVETIIDWSDACEECEDCEDVKDLPGIYYRLFKYLNLGE